jgi:RNA polymerase sigma-70 factor (ECF subfamily)
MLAFRPRRTLKECGTIVMTPPTEDRALVDATLAGDTAAFAILVERNSRRVISACSRILGDPTEAEDVAQDAFLRAYEALATFRGTGSFRAWVTRIAVRQAIARSMARRTALPIEGEDGAEGLAATLRSVDDVEQDSLDAELRREIMAAVAALPVNQREAIALRFVRDLSVAEIAELTGRPIGTVKSHLHRGMATLQARFRSRSTTDP